MLLVAIGFFLVALVELIVTRCNNSNEHAHGEDALESTQRLLDESGSPIAVYTMVFLFGVIICWNLKIINF